MPENPSVLSRAIEVSSSRCAGGHDTEKEPTAGPLLDLARPGLVSVRVECFLIQNGYVVLYLGLLSTCKRSGDSRSWSVAGSRSLHLRRNQCYRIQLSLSDTSLAGCSWTAQAMVKCSHGGGGVCRHSPLAPELSANCDIVRHLDSQL